MVALQDLWLPILLSGVAVFLASSILHMVLPLHRSDYGRIEGEDAVLDAMRAGGIGPGHYMFPHCTSMQDYASEEHQAKLAQGPSGFMTVLSGPVNMGKQLGIWFLHTLVVGVFCAYVTGLSVGEGAGFGDVMRRAGAVAFAAYGLGAVPESIWKGLRWGITAKFLFDGLVYALVTGAVFAAAWPAAA